jgi:asparagine synthetase B (glutamine-hydrolysing)
MTLIAGIFSRSDRPLADSACASLRQTISRNSTDEVEIFRDHRTCFAKVDIGAFCEPGFFQDENGALSLLAGEPLLRVRETSARANRLPDLTVIHEQCLENNSNILREADGTFCIVHYQPQTGTLSLIADKLGIRPLYFWMDDNLVVFASALRILEKLSFVPKKMDLRAVTEIVALGKPLADRTPYTGIFLLKSAEILQITGKGTSRSYYWRWDEIKTESDSEPSRLATVYDRFQAAVRRRNRDDGATTAYLSGGLDSRCVVATLCDSGARVRTVNFARPGTQDYYCGNDFAKRIGSIHQSLPKERGDSLPDFSALMARALEGFNHDQLPVERPRLVWSGDGGDVFLGCVYVSESPVELMRAGKVDRAIEAFVQEEHIDVPLKLLRPQILECVRDVIRQGIAEELDQLHAEDPGRNFYLFVVHNNQRRKLMGHFENIDLHRLEFQLPFFDAAFLESVIATPLDWLLKHRFYLKWLSLLPTPVTSVPWQAYPGHEPCPLPVPTEFAYQWDDSYQAEEDASQKRRVIEQASELLRSIDFPDQILIKRNLRLAKWIHSRGWRDYRYAIEAAQTYHAYAKKCGGEFTFSPR